MAGEGSRISLRISGINLTLERLAGSTSQELSLEVPTRIGEEGIERMTRDAEVLAQVLRNYPNEMRVLLEAVYSGQFDDARKVADALGVTESGFRSHDGAFFE